MKRRVVVTGVGLVSCLGTDYGTAIESLRAGRSGIRRMEGWREHGLKSDFAGNIDESLLEEKIGAVGVSKKLRPALSKAALYCVLAAHDAVRDSGLHAGELRDSPTGCFVGSGISSVESVYRAGLLYFAGKSRRIDPFTVLRSMSSSCSAAVASSLGTAGRSYSLSSACATSSHNIGHAYELISEGRLDHAIAGGGEEVAELTTAGFQALRLALATRFRDQPERASRPFDADRDGFVIGGGAGILVLESLDSAIARGARPRAEILAHAANSDGYDLVLPEPNGRRAAACISSALADGGLDPGDIDYINAHGTSTQAGDAAELNAFRAVFRDAIPPFSSTKSMTGHPLAAAGAIELVFSIGMIEHHFLAPSINVETPDPLVASAPLVTAPTPAEPKTILSNSFGFGGTNSCLIVGERNWGS